MKIVGVFDNSEEAVGLKLSGIDTTMVTSKEEAIRVIEDIVNQIDVGILVINHNIYEMNQEKIDEIKKHNFPLIIQL